MSDSLVSCIRAYFTAFPEECLRLKKFNTQEKEDRDLFSRKNFEGHVTASALVFNPEMDKVLLIHHKGLDKWLQPGGHVENDLTLWDAATREVREETGINEIQAHVWHKQYGGIPFDVDTHDIPARPHKGEPQHLHHDCLFIAVAADNIPITLQLDEVADAEWKPLDYLKTDQRLARVYKQIILRKAI